MNTTSKAQSTIDRVLSHVPAHCTRIEMNWDSHYGDTVVVSCVVADGAFTCWTTDGKAGILLGELVGHVLTSVEFTVSVNSWHDVERRQPIGTVRVEARIDPLGNQPRLAIYTVDWQTI